MRLRDYRRLPNESFPSCVPYNSFFSFDATMFSIIKWQAARQLALSIKLSFLTEERQKDLKKEGNIAVEGKTGEKVDTQLCFSQSPIPQILSLIFLHTASLADCEAA